MKKQTITIMKWTFGALAFGFVSFVGYKIITKKPPTEQEVADFGKEIKDSEAQSEPTTKDFFPLDSSKFGITDKKVYYIQKGLNIAYGAGLKEDSVWGVKTQTALLTYHKRYTIVDMADYAKILKELNTIAINRK